MDDLWPQNPNGRKDWMWKDLPPSSPPTDYNPADHFSKPASKRTSMESKEINLGGRRRLKSRRIGPSSNDQKDTEQQGQAGIQTNEGEHANKQVNETPAEDPFDSADKVDVQLRAPPSSDMAPLQGSERDVALLLGVAPHQVLLNTTPQYDTVLPKKLFSLAEASDPVKPMASGMRVKKAHNRSSLIGEEVARVAKNQNSRA
ncbi:hypothetical protein AAF712_016363 [Marasmius tenuissimus]|uniref:Uncharacterized protein n=1 Tax=Marasmius tenuissimus TaxID=585030 RepID=A0ABR2Z6Z6_9AGAR